MGYGLAGLTVTHDSLSVWPFLWPLGQILPQFGQILRRAVSLGRPVRQVQLVRIPSKLLELNVEDFADATAGLQGRDESESSQPSSFVRAQSRFFFAWLEPLFALERVHLPNTVRWIIRQVLPFQNAVEDRFEPTETSIR